MPSNIVIMWFRQDLRLSDNPALLAASQQGKIVAVYILDKASEWSRGKASNWWLHHSLSALNKSLNGNDIRTFGIVAYGRDFFSDVSVSEISFYD